MLIKSTLLALVWFGAVSSLTTQITEAQDTLGAASDLTEDLGSTDDTDELDIPAEKIPAEGPGVSSTANYSDDQMSIDYPASWQIVVNQDGNIQILDGTEGSADQVVTEVFVVDSPPGALINANIDSFITEGSVVGPYGQVTIDDPEAFTIWLAERPMALSRAIATFIGYDDQTVLLFSSFMPENEAVEDRLLELHSSFKKVVDAEREPESTLENNQI